MLSGVEPGNGGVMFSLVIDPNSLKVSLAEMKSGNLRNL